MLLRFLRTLFPMAPIGMEGYGYLPVRVRRRHSALLRYSRQ